MIEYTYEENEDVMNEINRVVNLKDDDLDDLLDGNTKDNTDTNQPSPFRRARVPTPSPNRRERGKGDNAPQPSAGTATHQPKLPKDLDWNDVLNEKRLGRLDALEERQQWVPRRNRSHFNYSNGSPNLFSRIRELIGFMNH